MTPVLILVLLLAVAVLIGFVTGHNKLRAADVRAEEALGGIDVQLTRRASLIPSLVSTVQCLAGHEKSVLVNIAYAQAALMEANKKKTVETRK